MSRYTHNVRDRGCEMFLQSEQDAIENRPESSGGYPFMPRRCSKLQAEFWDKKIWCDVSFRDEKANLVARDFAALSAAKKLLAHHNIEVGTARIRGGASTN